MRRSSCVLLLAALVFVNVEHTWAQEFRTLDGFGNNASNPDWGTAGEKLLRQAPAAYSDGISAPSGATRPSPREVSNLICAQPALRLNSRNASDFLWQWGQFLDHDLDLSEAGFEFMPIPVPAGDPWFDPMGTGSVVLPFVRSEFDPLSTPREQVNRLTAFIDASNVYGSEDDRALALRTLDGTGKLLTSPGELLPYNVLGLPNAHPDGADPADFFLAGDVRANEQIGLTAMHTLFVREHNRLCDELALSDPLTTGDERYYLARRIVGAQMQAITYQEFLPLLLGPGAIPPYTGYDPAVNPGITNEFATAAYRIGHTMLASMVLRYEESGSPIDDGNIPLAECFFAPHRITDEGGIEPILRGLASKAAQEIDHEIDDAIRNFLFGPPGSGGLDLASLNIQRGRDHGLPDYNSLRVAYGLAPVTSFAEIHPDPAVQSALATAYSSVDDIDPWVGIITEPHAPGALVGELARAILADQFTRVRDGDRFWCEHDLPPALMAEVASTTLADVIRRNTDIVDISDTAFIVPTFTRGDCSPDGTIDIADAIALLDFLFNRVGEPGCEKQCDANDDARLDLGDAITVCSGLFAGGTIPGPVACGWDDTDDLLGCYRSSCP